MPGGISVEGFSETCAGLLDAPELPEDKRNELAVGLASVAHELASRARRGFADERERVEAALTLRMLKLLGLAPEAVGMIAFTYGLDLVTGEQMRELVVERGMNPGVFGL